MMLPAPAVVAEFARSTLSGSALVIVRFRLPAGAGAPSVPLNGDCRFLPSVSAATLRLGGGTSTVTRMDWKLLGVENGAGGAASATAVVPTACGSNWTNTDPTPPVNGAVPTMDPTASSEVVTPTVTSIPGRTGWQAAQDGWIK